MGESRGGRSTVHNSPYGLCGRKATLILMMMWGFIDLELETACLCGDYLL